MVRQDLVSIVILTYNQIDYTRLCLESLRSCTTWPHELIVVDNGSTDGTVEYLRSLPDVKLILNDENLGFARGCNQGMALAEGEFILLLNNDTVLTPGWLDNLVECARSSPDIGMVGPRSNYVSGEQWLDTSYTGLEEMQEFAREFNRGGSDLWFEITRLVGFCLLIKREVVDKVGYLDEGFGLGSYEDDDYSVRVRRAGYRLMVAGNTFVHHFGNQTFTGNNINIYEIMDENRSKFMKKWGVQPQEPPAQPIKAEERLLAAYLWRMLFLRDRLEHERLMLQRGTLTEVFHRGITACLDGRYDEALLAFEKANRSLPRVYPLQYNLGLANLQAGNIQRGVEWLEDALSGTTGSAEAWSVLGDAFLCLKRLEEAQGCFERALQCKPGLKPARLGLTLTLQVRQGLRELPELDGLVDLVACKKQMAMETGEKLSITYLPVITRTTGGAKITFEHINRLTDRGHQVNAISYCEHPQWFPLQVQVRELSVKDHLWKQVPQSDIVVATFWNQIHDILKTGMVPVYLVQGDAYLFERDGQYRSQGYEPDVQRVVDELYQLPVSLISVSRLLQRLLKDSYGRNSYFVPNAIDHQVFYPEDQRKAVKKRILVVGSGSESFKGIRDVFLALDRVRVRHQDLEVVWVSPGPRNDIFFDCTFIQNPDQEKLGRIYASCDLFVSGSHYESFSLPPLEAMASGVAVVTTANEGVKEYAVHGHNCLMVPIKDPEKMAEAIIMLLEDDGLRARLIDNGLRTAREYKWDKTMSCLEEVYWNLAIEPRPLFVYQLEGDQPVSSNRTNYYHWSRPELVDLVPLWATRVLDVGCGAGVMGQELKKRGVPEVVGIEINPAIAEEARSRLDRVLVGDVEAMELPFPEHYFDAIVYGDVLEHLHDPWTLLSRHKRHLAEGGCIICSIPNAGHMSVVKNLLAGKWEYQPAGIMDRTHLRFFTLAEMRTMLENAGFSVNQVKRVEEPLDKEEEILLQKLKATGAATEEFIQGAPVVQYLLVAAPLEQDHVTHQDSSVQPSSYESRPTLSLCMIVENEEEYLPRCLASVQGVVDEIIVVDTGSTDRTVEIARGFGARVYHHPWGGDFSEARNVSLEHATGDWILFLDADEELVEEDREKLRELLNDRVNEGFYLNEINFVGDQPGLEAVLNLAFRLFRNRKEYRFTGAIHEQIVACVQRHNPNIGFSSVRVNHYGYLNRPSVEKNKVSRNLEILLQEVERNPRDNFTRFNLGVEYMRLELYDKALEQYQKAFHKLPSLEVAYASILLRNIALCLKELKRYKEALKVLADAVQAYPDYTDLVFLKGLVYLEMKRYREAADTFQECLRRGESGQCYITQQGVGGYKAWLALGDTYLQLGDEREAVKAYTRALMANARFPVPVHRLASLLLPREEVEEVKAFFARHLDLEARDVLLHLAQAFARERRYEDALAYLDAAIAREGKPANLAFTRGEYLLNLKRYREAVEEFEEVPRDSQYFYPALLDKAFCHLLEGEYARASRDLGVVADSPLYYVHSITYQYLLRLLAGERPQKVVFAQKEDGEKFAALAWDALGKMLGLQEFESFEKVLPILDDLEDPAKLLKLGKLYYRQGYLDSAAEELLRAVQEGVFDSEAFAILGEACRERDLLEDAEVFFSQAMALDPEQVNHYTALTSVLARQRKYDRAKEVVKLGIRKFPNSELLKASLQTLEMPTGLSG